MIGLDFDTDILFGNKIPLPATTISHGVYNNDIPTVREFNDRMTEECTATQLLERTQHLYCKYQFTEEDHHKMETIDQLLTCILVTNNQKCRKYSPIPWSLTLHRIYLTHCYWKIHLSEAHTKKNYSAALRIILNRLPETPENGKTISSNLQKIQSDLREIR